MSSIRLHLVNVVVIVRERLMNFGQREVNVIGDPCRAVTAVENKRDTGSITALCTLYMRLSNSEVQLFCTASWTNIAAILAPACLGD